MNEAERALQIESLTHQYRAEMVKQNNLSSVVRNYAQADRIQAQIRKIEGQK